MAASTPNRHRGLPYINTAFNALRLHQPADLIASVLTSQATVLNPVQGIGIIIIIIIETGTQLCSRVVSLLFSLDLAIKTRLLTVY